MRRTLGGRHALLWAGIVFIAALGVFAVLILAEDDPPASAEELPAACQPGLPYVTCTYTSSTKLSFNSMLSQIEGAVGRKSSASTPVWVQAWGGRGAKGASSGGYAGAYGGYAGYAITVSSAGTLTGNTLYLYVGASGSKHANYSGQGGAASIVSTQPISVNSSVPGSTLVVAGGSGGGGNSCGDGGGGRGGAGGVAVAGHVKHDALSGQKNFNPGYGGGGGTGGYGGSPGGNPGGNGLGGYGGAGNSDGSSTGWVNVAAVDPAATGFNAGAGGEGRGGGGGGGYGGGGGGGGCKGSGTERFNGGGGGGGSWTLEPNAVNDSDAPIDSKQDDGAQSKVVLTFNFS